MGRQRPIPGAGVSQYRTDYTVHEELKSYRGINTWLYPDGSIAPRPPWTLYPFTGLPSGKSLKCFQTAVPAISWFGWAFSDGTVYTTPLVGGAPALVAALRGTLGNNPSDSVAVGPYMYFISNAGTGAGKVHTDGTFTAFTGPQADLIVQYGSQTLALSQTTSRLYWSAPDDPTSWPAANVVVVGDSTISTGLYVQRDTVIVTKLDGSVWMFTGTLGVNETLRRIDVGLQHPFAGVAKGAVVGKSVLYFTTGAKMTAFTGAELKTISRPDMPAVSGYDSSPKTDNVATVVSTGEPNCFLCLGTMDNTSSPLSRLPWFHSFSPDAGWNRHTFPAAAYTLTAAALGGLTSADSALGIRTSNHVDGHVLAVRPSDAAAPSTPKTWIFNPRQESPYDVAVPSQWWGSQTATLDGDLSTPPVATFQSAEWWAPEGQEATVRELQIHFSYDSDAGIVSALGAEIGHKFDVVVEAVQRMDGGSLASASTTFIPTTTNTTAVDGGTMRRGKVRIPVGDQGPGGGFRWTLADWRGIKIHWVLAFVDVGPVRI